MGVFDQVIGAAQSAGVFGFYLPFLVTFALIYGLLSRAKIFGDPKDVKTANVINAIIAFSIAFYVLGFTSAGVTVSQYLGTFFSQTTIALVTLIVGVIVLVLVGETLGPAIVRADQRGQPVMVGRGYELGKYVGIIAVLIVIGVFINSGGLSALGLAGPSTGAAFGLSGQDILIIAFVLITVGLIYWVSSSGKEK